MAGYEVDWGKAQDALRITNLEWSVPVLVALMRGPCSWTLLRRQVHAATMRSPRTLHDKVFNRTLAAMVREGVIEREEQEGVFPPSVTYRLARKAEGVVLALESYDHWERGRRA